MSSSQFAPLVSVIIPNKDHHTDLDLCIRSLIERGTWKNLEFFVVEKLATGLAFMFMRPTDRPQFITYAISLMIVCIMCPVMSLVATLLFKEPSFGMWVHTWGCNMPMALCWQMLYCGPLARAIFRLVFRRGEKQAM